MVAAQLLADRARSRALGLRQLAAAALSIRHGEPCWSPPPQLAAWPPMPASWQPCSMPSSPRGQPNPGPASCGPGRPGSPTAGCPGFGGRAGSLLWWPGCPLSARSVND